MAQSPSDEAMTRIFAEVARHAHGIGVEALQAAPNNTVARRTLQRRLAELVRPKQLTVEGEGRALRYRLAMLQVTSIRQEAFGGSVATSERYAPTSPEGAEIKAYVRQPTTERRPVAYNIRFLEAYAPNHTFYLGSSLRAQLHALGRSALYTVAQLLVAL